MTCRQLDQNLSGHFCAPDQYNPVSLKNSELKFSFSAAASQPRLWWPVCVSRVPLSCSLGCLLGCGGVVRAQERCCLTAIILTLVSLHHRLDLPGFVGRALSFHRFLWDPSPTSALLLPRTTASCPPPDDLSESFQHFSGAHLSRWPSQPWQLVQSPPLPVSQACSEHSCTVFPKLQGTQDVSQGSPGAPFCLSSGERAEELTPGNLPLFTPSPLRLHTTLFRTFNWGRVPLQPSLHFFEMQAFYFLPVQIPLVWFYTPPHTHCLTVSFEGYLSQAVTSLYIDTCCRFIFLLGMPLPLLTTLLGFPGKPELCFLLLWITWSNSLLGRSIAGIP